MLNALILFSLRNRPLVLAGALAVLVLGGLVAPNLPIDVLPDLTRPRVVLIAECPGMAPEEVERSVTFPLETAINGAGGVIAVRSSSDIGLSVIYVEFDWGTDPYRARQVVQERLLAVNEQLPEGVRPRMGPMASLLGQIMMISLRSETGETKPLELRSLADWRLRPRLLAIPGVSEVITQGGGRKQFQVLVDLHMMHQLEVTLDQIERALASSSVNVTGGYVDRGSTEYLVRGLGRVVSISDIEQVVVRPAEPRPILIKNVARVVEGAQPKRGDASYNGHDAVLMTIQKQPGADTRSLTEQIEAAVASLRGSLPPDVVVEPRAYRQREFIDYGVSNVMEALRDGSLLVVLVLLLFLANLRTTFITLTAIPLSVLVTMLVFRWMGQSINVMTLGGVAVALGELVDDAIVDVENILRRLRENSDLAQPRPALQVIYDASREVRGAIVVSTAIVILVFAPLFALSGMEGRLFTPLGVAYVTSILASMAVSLTVTPVLSYYLLPSRGSAAHAGDGVVLRGLKSLAAPVVRWSMTRAGLTLAGTATLVLVVASVVQIAAMGKNFLPPFDEGAAQVNLFAPPGTSLDAMRSLSRLADARFAELLVTDTAPGAPLLSFTCRMGRAELDEHVMGVNVAEYVMTLNPKCEQNRAEVIELLHTAAEGTPGVGIEVEQPIAHLISHMISGVTAQIAIKLYGDDLGTLRRYAEQIKSSIADMPGIAPPVVEQQRQVPQLRVELDRDRLATLGLSAGAVQGFVETAMNGRTVGKVIEGERTFDLVVRMDDSYRTSPRELERTPIELPGGGVVPLARVAKVYPSTGPNTIARENAQRRIVVRVNTAGLDLEAAVTQIRERIARQVALPNGYHIELSGQFEAQQQATRRILVLSVVSVAGAFVMLFSVFGSASIVWQVLSSLPVALIGGVWALVLTGQDLSIAGLVGFISLGGIAARNGVLLAGAYGDLARAAGGLTREVILRGSLERLCPVMMTSLTAGLALLPLVIGGEKPGKEILYPVATVIVGGLLTSTLCEFLLRPGMYWYFTPHGMFLKPSEEESLVDAAA